MMFVKPYLRMARNFDSLKFDVVLKSRLSKPSVLARPSRSLSQLGKLSPSIALFGAAKSASPAKRNAERSYFRCLSLWILKIYNVFRSSDLFLFTMLFSVHLSLPRALPRFKAKRIDVCEGNINAHRHLGFELTLRGGYNDTGVKAGEVEASGGSEESQVRVRIEHESEGSCRDNL